MYEGFWERSLDFLQYIVVSSPMMCLSGLFTYLSFTRFLPAKNVRWKKVVLFIGQLSTVHMVIFVGDPINILGILPVYFLCVLVCASGRFIAKTAVGLIFFTITISINAIIDNIFLPIFNNVHLVFSRLPFWLLIYLGLRCFFPGKKEEIHLSKRLWLLLNGLTIAPFAAVLAGITRTPEVYPMDFTSAIVVTLPFVLLSSISLLVTMVVLSRQEAIEKERQIAQLSQSYYTQLEQQQVQVRRLRHDMANHLQTMAALSAEEVKPYLNLLINDSALQSGKHFCENNIANVILAAKNAQMQDEDIEAEILVSLPQKLPFADTDICVLFGNSLDNAIEACRKVPVDQRHISIKSRADKGIFAFQVENPCQEKLQQKKGHLLSSKSDPDNHGFGTRSIQSIVQKYNGTVTFTSDSNTFELLLYLPLQGGG